MKKRPQLASRCVCERESLLLRAPRSRVAVCCRVLQCGVVRCSVVQCVAVCTHTCSHNLLPSIAFIERHNALSCCSVLQCAVGCCSVLQCGAVRCNVLQCAAVCCRVHAYRVAKTHRMPDLDSAFSAKEPYT